jgi:DNA polymerase-3 subunit delta'
MSEHETDRAPGLAHPRETYDLIGHESAERAVASAMAQGRLHHAWLITGPKGVGKATFAYRMARVLLGGERLSPHTLAVSPEDPVARRIAALGHADLRILRRPWDDKTGKAKADIPVDEARRLGEFFALTAGEGGARVAIVDTGDDLNRNAANALLKTLEEPPPRGVMILLAHAPGALLATIRSRCSVLRLAPLDPDAAIKAIRARTDLDPPDARLLADLSAGAIGQALSLAACGGAALYRELVSSLAVDRPGLPTVRRIASEAGKRGEETRFHLTFHFLRDWLARAMKASAGLDLTPRVEEEAKGLARAATAAPKAWAQAFAEVSAIEQETDALTMDRTAAVYAAFEAIGRANRSARA